MNCLGIDPGSNSVGLCYWCTGSALRFARVNKSTSTKLNDLEQDIDFIARISQAVADISATYIHVAVLEEPKDAQTHWSAGKGGPMQLGSLFAMGKGYGLCLAALSHLRWSRGRTIDQLVSYQVKSNKHGEGWQPRFKIPRAPKGFTRQAKGSPQKDMLLAQLRSELGDLSLGLPLNNYLTLEQIRHLSEHELMAFGVLGYHLRKTGSQ